MAHSHHKIYNSSHFFISGYETKGNGASIDFVVTTPDTARWIHMTFSIKGTWYEHVNE